MARCFGKKELSEKWSLKKENITLSSQAEKAIYETAHKRIPAKTLTVVQKIR